MTWTVLEDMKGGLQFACSHGEPHMILTHKCDGCCFPMLEKGKYVLLLKGDVCAHCELVGGFDSHQDCSRAHPGVTVAVTEEWGYSIGVVA